MFTTRASQTLSPISPNKRCAWRRSAEGVGEYRRGCGARTPVGSALAPAHCPGSRRLHDRDGQVPPPSDPRMARAAPKRGVHVGLPGSVARHTREPEGKLQLDECCLHVAAVPEDDAADLSERSRALPGSWELFRRACARRSAASGSAYRFLQQPRPRPARQCLKSVCGGPRFPPRAPPPYSDGL